MRGVICRRGRGGDLRRARSSRPCRRGEMLITVEATGVNYADSLMVQGATRRGRRFHSAWPGDGRRGGAMRSRRDAPSAVTV